MLVHLRGVGLHPDRRGARSGGLAGGRLVQGRRGHRQLHPAARGSAGARPGRLRLDRDLQRTAPLRVRGALQGPAVLRPLRLRRPVRRLQRQRALGRQPARRRRRLAALLQPRRRQRRRSSDGRLERRANDRGGGARQRGGVQRLPPADPPAGRGRRCPPRRDLHQLQPRRVGPGHDRDLRRQPADVERQRILRRLHGSEGGDGHRAGRGPDAPGDDPLRRGQGAREPASVLVVVPLRRRPADAEPPGGRAARAT